MDGVIYVIWQTDIAGVPEFIQWLHMTEKKEYLFSQITGYTPRELNQKLADGT